MENKQKAFEDVIKLGEEVSRDDAIYNLAKIYGAALFAIMESLPDLKIFKDSKFVFEKATKNGIECISMSGYNEKKEVVCQSFINIKTGRQVV